MSVRQNVRSGFVVAELERCEGTILSSVGGCVLSKSSALRVGDMHQFSFHSSFYMFFYNVNVMMYIFQ